MFSVGFDNPWVLLTALPLAALAMWMLWRTESPLSSVRRYIGGISLGFASLCLTLAASQPHVELSRGSRTIFVLVDRSLSAGDAAARRLPDVLARLIRELGEGDYLGVISFSDVARMELEPRKPSRVNHDLQLSRPEPSEETWVRPALELAAASAVPGTAVEAVIIGDGHDSSLRYGTDVRRSARLSGVRISALAVDSEPLPEAALSDFSARLAGREQLALDVAFVIYSTVRQRVTFNIRVNGEPAVEQQRDVEPGRNPVALRLPQENRLANYIVEVAISAPQDTSTRNNRLRLPVTGPGEARVLLLHRRGAPEDSLASVLKEGGVRIVQSEPSGMPSDPLELGRYQALILSDVALPELPAGAAVMIERFTREGGGLVMIGGPRSFAPGGYYDTEVERALPVTCDVTEQGRKQQPALLMVLDRSGSMGALVGERTKMQLANEGCALSVELAPFESFFGMLAVDTGPHWIIPLTPLKDKASARALAMSSEVGGGGIYCRIAMEEALGAIRAVKASSRHIVLFADGADAEQQENVVEMVRRASENEQITTSVICLGRGPDVEFLRQVAQAGKGRFELVEDARQLPVVFSREAAQLAGAYIREEPFLPVRGAPSALTDGVDFGEGTRLAGYVATTARQQASVLLWADDEKQRPLAACWYYGLGRSLAFTSDAGDRWASNWLQWGGYSRLWQRWVRWVLPSVSAVQGAEIEWAVGREGPQLTASFFEVTGEPRSLRRPRAEITAPDGAQSSVPVLAVGPGRYGVQLPHAGSGVYTAVIVEEPQGEPPLLAAREHLVYAPVDELRARPADLAALNSLCQVTGGRLLARPGDFFGLPGQTVTYRLRLAEVLVVMGMILGFLYLAARRFPFVRASSGEPRKARVETSSVSTAYEQVRKRLERKLAPSPVPAMPAPVASTPPPVAEPPSPVSPVEGGLVSAMRRARREMRGHNSGDGQ